MRSALTTAALVAGGCTAVCLSPATTEAHVAFFLTAVLLGCYRDWSVYPVAVAGAVVLSAGPSLMRARAALPGPPERLPAGGMMQG